MNWTDEQRRAINNRGGTLLVSAAAGSGKTSVLVERVIRRLTDPVNRCPANELLIVTFTRAAAAHMKTKIMRELGKIAAKDPSPFLTEQKLLLGSAKIGTIDSFCGDLVRENFFTLGLSPDFGMLTDAEEQRLKQACVKAVLDERYAAEDPDFEALAAIAVAGGKDARLGEAIIELYDCVSVYPDPDGVLDQMLAPYLEDLPARETVWGRELLGELNRLAGLAERLLRQGLAEASADAETLVLLRDVFSDDISYCEHLLEKSAAGDWDCLYSLLHSRSFARWPGKTKGIDPDVKNRAKLPRAEAVAVLKSAADLIFIPSEELRQDRLELLPAVRALRVCMSLFTEEMNKRKKADNAYTFNDVEHFAFDLLAEKGPDGALVRSELAVQVGRRYREVMVDEYQDTNALQDTIFALLSDEKNLFMVGDVKQSIYRFRHAMPDIFLTRRERFGPFNGSDYPGTVLLTSNFRSLACVTAPVNFVFGKIMSAELGDVDYNENERLNCERTKDSEKLSYPTELILRDKNCSLTEAQVVAQRIRELLAEGSFTAGDICVLTRNKNFAPYMDALKALDIPVVCPADASIGETAESRMIISLLRVIDNPLRDVELAAVMMSPLFGFSSDELAHVRAGCEKNEPVWRSVLRQADAGSEKCRALLDKLDEIRYLSTGEGAFEFLRKLYDLTDIRSVAGVLPQPEKRLENLDVLLSAAASFDGSGKLGISAFLRYIDRLSVSSSSSSALEDSHSVKICNIHKSKGLEFKVCILSDVDRPVFVGNRGILTHSRLPYKASGRGLQPALGLRKKEKISGKTCTTPAFAACENANERLDHSEGMRLLYVALTRAMDKLIFVGSPQKSMTDLLNKLSLCAADSSGRIDPDLLRTENSFFFCLAAALVHHESARALFDSYGDLVPGPGFFEKADFELVARCVTGEMAAPEALPPEEESETPAPDPDTLEKLRARLDYTYPYAALAGVYSKLQASGGEEGFDADHFASSAPRFASSGKPGSAERGTLTHLFMQNLCLEADCGLQQQLERVIASGALTREETESIRLDEVEHFLASPMFRRICAADEVHRERKFSLRLPVSETEEALSGFDGEFVVVQGMIDLFFIENGKAYVVDYKTDRGADERTLIERHSRQIKLYARAVEKCFGCPVGDAYILSLPLNKAISIF